MNTQVGPDWAKAREVADALLFILRRERAAKRGVTVPLRVKDDPTGDKARIHARAVDILRAEHPELDVTVWKDELFITFKASLDVLKSGDFDKSMAALAATREEDLVDRAEVVHARPERTDPVDEVYERWPGALQGRDIRDVKGGEYAEWKAGERERAEERERREKVWQEKLASAPKEEARGATVAEVAVITPEGEHLTGSKAEPGALRRFVTRVMKSLRG